MVAAFSLTALLFASAISAKPVVDLNHLVHLPLTNHWRNFTATYNIVEHDRRRAEALIGGARGVVDKSLQSRDSGISTQATNQFSAYSASVGVGNPPTTYKLLIDSGSSNTWVGSRSPYVKTKTSRPTSNAVGVSYGSGKFSGREFIDQVTIGEGLVIQDQSIGVATPSTAIGFQDVDGILGIGPIELTRNTLSPDSEDTIPTVTDNLFSKNIIKSHLISVFYTPLSANENSNGRLTWGGIDTSNIVGSITYTPRTKTSPASGFWGIEASINYGTTSILSKSSGIVDTGTTLLLLPKDAYDTYTKTTGAVPDMCGNTGLLVIDPSQFQRLQSLSFVISNVAFDLIPNAQIYPRHFNTAIGGVASKIYLVIGELEGDTDGLRFVMGMVFLQRYMSIYDSGNQQVGFAKTPKTNAVSN